MLRLVVVMVVVVQVFVYPLVECAALFRLAAAAVAGLVVQGVGATCYEAVGGVVYIPLAVVRQPGLQGRAAGWSQQCSPALLCTKQHAVCQ